MTASLEHQGRTSYGDMVCVVLAPSKDEAETEAKQRLGDCVFVMVHLTSKGFLWTFRKDEK